MSLPGVSYDITTITARGQELTARTRQAAVRALAGLAEDRGDFERLAAMLGLNPSEARR